jgi:hypothetical protein
LVPKYVGNPIEGCLHEGEGREDSLGHGGRGLRSAGGTDSSLHSGCEGALATDESSSSSREGVGATQASNSVRAGEETVEGGDEGLRDLQGPKSAKTHIKDKVKR